jgi:hypothetical protein
MTENSSEKLPDNQFPPSQSGTINDAFPCKSKCHLLRQPGWYVPFEKDSFLRGTHSIIKRLVALGKRQSPAAVLLKVQVLGNLRHGD